MKFYVLLALLSATSAIRLHAEPAAAPEAAPATPSEDAASKAAGETPPAPANDPAAAPEKAAKDKAESGTNAPATHFGTAQDHALTKGQAVAAAAVSG